MQKFTLKVAFLLLISILINHKSWSQQKEEAITQAGTSKSAEYPNGQAEMYNFIQNNLKYPKNGANCMQGNVFLNFCVEADGSVTNIKVQKGLCPDFDKEAIRVFSIMPKWKPALDFGTPVKSYYTMPCKFRLE